MGDLRQMTSYKESNEELHANFIDYIVDNNIEGIKTSLSNGMNPNIDLQDGWTPLMLASFNGHYETVKILTEHGADVNAANESRRKNVEPIKIPQNGPIL